MKFDQRPAGRGDDLERAQHALAVARPQSRSSQRIARRQRRVQARRRLPLGLGAHRRAHRFGHARDVGQAFGEGAEIEAGAADEDQRARGANRRGFRPARSSQRPAEKFSATSTSPNRRCGARRSSAALGRAVRTLQVGVDLHRVGVDDRSAEPLGELQRDRRLAARRRAGDRRPRPIALFAERPSQRA